MRPMIVCVTGLPCIGKTYMLRRLCVGLGLEYIEFDEVRNAWMPRSSALHEFGEFIFSGFPLTSSEWSRLIGSVDNFLAFYAWFSKLLSHRLQEEIVVSSRRGAQGLVCEMSPFALDALERSIPVIFCSVGRELHASRLISHLGCSEESARRLEGFFLRALSRTGVHVRAARSIGLASLPSELAYRLR